MGEALSLSLNLNLFTMKKKYTAVGEAGITVHHVHAFDSIDALKKHLATKPKGIVWHIMETIEIVTEGPSTFWDLETSKKINSKACQDKWATQINSLKEYDRRVRLCHHMAYNKMAINN
jgi:hypothetical protein